MVLVVKGLKFGVQLCNLTMSSKSSIFNSEGTKVILYQYSDVFFYFNLKDYEPMNIYVGDNNFEIKCEIRFKDEVLKSIEMVENINNMLSTDQIETFKDIINDRLDPIVTAWVRLFVYGGDTEQSRIF